MVCTGGGISTRRVYSRSRICSVRAPPAAAHTPGAAGPGHLYPPVPSRPPSRRGGTAAREQSIRGAVTVSPNAARLRHAPPPGRSRPYLRPRPSCGQLRHQVQMIAACRTAPNRTPASSPSGASPVLSIISARLRTLLIREFPSPGAAETRQCQTGLSNPGPRKRPPAADSANPARRRTSATRPAAVPAQFRRSPNPATR